MRAVFQCQVPVPLLCGLLLASAVGRGRRLLGRRLRGQNRAASPLTARRLSLLVVLSRPLVTCYHRGTDQYVVPREDMPEGELYRARVPPSGPSLSYELLGDTFRGIDAAISVRYLRAPTLAALQQALADRYDALVYDGFAAEDGSLSFESPYGERHMVPPGQVGGCMRESGVRLVFLSGCFSKATARALRREGVVAVAGTIGPVLGEVAAAGVGAFFAAMAGGKNVHQALAHCRKALSAHYDSQAKKPSARLSAWRWPALRLVLADTTCRCSEENPLQTPSPLVCDELLGREENIVQINRQLARHRLITLIGPDGIGKSSLARAVACWRWQRDLDAAGARVISLGHVHSGLQLADELSRHLAPAGLSPEPPNQGTRLSDRVRRLAPYLAQGRRLLLLDNVVRLDDEARWLLEQLLAQCESLQLLLTSSGPAGLNGEFVFPVDPLDPDGAVELFQHRAKHAIDAETEKGITAICQVVGGVPLAIELVARHSEQAPAETLLALREVDIAQGSAGSRPEGGTRLAGTQQGVARSLQYGYGRLSREARRMLCALAVFRGKTTREAVQSVTGDLEHGDQALEELLDRYLLKQEQTDGSWRYWLLPAVAEYAAASLHQDAAKLDLDVAALLHRHAAYYLGVAAQMDALLSSGEAHPGSAEGTPKPTAQSGQEAQQRMRRDALSLLDQERANLLAAAEGAYQTKAWDLVLRLAQNLSRGLCLGSYWTEAERIYLLATTAARQAGDPHGEGQMLNNLGQVYRQRGRWNEAIARFKQELAIRGELGDSRGEAETLNTLGLVYADQRRWSDASETFRESLRTFRQLQYLRGVGTTLDYLGDIAMQQGCFTEAGQIYRESIQAFRQSADHQENARMLHKLGLTYAEQGHLAKAIDAQQESLHIWRELGDRRAEGVVLNAIGAAYSRHGHWAEAIAHYERSLQLCRETGNRRGEGQALGGLGTIYASQNRWDDAIARHEESLQIYRELGDRQAEGLTLYHLSSTHALQGSWDKALSLSQESLQIFRELEDLPGQGRALRSLGSIYANHGEPEEAISASEEGLRIFRELQDRHNEAKALADLGMVHANQGRWAEAVARHRESLCILRELGDRQDEGETLNSLGHIYALQGNRKEAVTYYRQYLAICRELGDLRGEALTLNNLGSTYSQLARWKEALAHYEQYRELCCETEDLYGQGRTLGRIGDTYCSMGRFVEAIRKYQEGLDILRELGDRRGEGEVLANLGLVYAHQGSWAEAVATCEKGLQVFRELGDRRSEGKVLSNLGLVYADQGYWRKAIALYQESLDIFREQGDRTNEGQTLNNLGNAHRMHGRWSEAIACYEQYLAICRELGNPDGEKQTLDNLGGIFARQGQWREAIACHEQYLDICRQMADLQGQGKTLASLSLIYADQARWSEAISTSQESLDIYRSIGDRYNEGKMLTNLGLIYARQGQEGIAVARWYQALFIFEALGVPEAEQIRGWLREREAQARRSSEQKPEEGEESAETSLPRNWAD